MSFPNGGIPPKHKLQKLGLHYKPKTSLGQLSELSPTSPIHPTLALPSHPILTPSEDGRCRPSPLRLLLLFRPMPPLTIMRQPPQLFLPSVVVVITPHLYTDQCYSILQIHSYGLPLLDDQRRAHHHTPSSTLFPRKSHLS